MKKILFTILLCIAPFSQTFAFLGLDDTEKKVREFVPELKALGDKYADDTEIQLGLGFLYSRYGAPAGCSAEKQYEKVLAIDPNNRAALAFSSRRFCRHFTAKRNSLLDQLERKINHATKGNLKELKIPDSTALYHWLKEEGKIETRGRGKYLAYAVVIKDFDLAGQQLREKLHKEVPAVLAALDKGQSNDPDNAFYNYLKAHLYFELGQKDKAFSEIEEGTEKDYFSSYVEEISRAKAKALQEVNFPQPQRDEIASTRNPFEDFLIHGIWKRGLSELGKSYEAQGDFPSAEKIYRLTIKMAQQSQRESIYRPLGLDVMAQKRIDEFQKKTPNQAENGPDQGRPQKAKYAAIAGLCAILIIGLILLLKKKASSRRKSCS